MNGRTDGHIAYTCSAETFRHTLNSALFLLSGISRVQNVQQESLGHKDIFSSLNMQHQYCSTRLLKFERGQKMWWSRKKETK